MTLIDYIKYIIYTLFENSIEQLTEKLQIAIPFPPKQWLLSFFCFLPSSSSLVIEVISSSKAKYNYRTLFLSPEDQENSIK